jgi:hypothetical protein
LRAAATRATGATTRRADMVAAAIFVFGACGGASRVRGATATRRRRRSPLWAGTKPAFASVALSVTRSRALSGSRASDFEQTVCAYGSTRTSYNRSTVHTFFLVFFWFFLAETAGLVVVAVAVARSSVARRRRNKTRFH